MDLPEGVRQFVECWLSAVPRGYRAHFDANAAGGEQRQPVVGRMQAACVTPRQREVSHVFVPGVRQDSPVPERLLPFVLGFFAIAATLLGWAFLAASPIANESRTISLPSVPASSVRSVAYAVPEGGRDVLYVRSIDGGKPRAIASFAVPYGFDSFRAHGMASPTGDTVAVISVIDPLAGKGQLTFVHLADEARMETVTEIDAQGPLAWSAHGTHLATTHTAAATDGSRVDVTIVQVDASTGETAALAEFDSVFQAVPVGYSIDGARLFVVVIDQSGSTLFAVRQDGEAERVASLATGRTRDWSLSPDGSRLAYVEFTTSGRRGYAGRTLVVATGSIIPSEGTGNEYGATWRPGSPIPDFGGPGGTIRLSDPSLANQYVFPSSWAPDGSTMVATIYSAASDRGVTPSESLELVTTTSRERLADQAGARFFGWVVNLD